MGSLEAGPATRQRGKGKRRREDPETVLLLSKSPQPPRGDQPERSTVPGWGPGKCSAGQPGAGRRAFSKQGTDPPCAGHAGDSSGTEAGGFTHPFSSSFSVVHPPV